LRSDRLALAAALALTLCGALAAVAFPPLTPILLAPAVVLAAAARPAGLLLAPLAAALPLPFALRIALLAAAGAAALAAALARVTAGASSSVRSSIRSRASTAPSSSARRSRSSCGACIATAERSRSSCSTSTTSSRSTTATGTRRATRFLRRAGQVLRTAARDSDVAARFGGEELVLLVRGDERSATAAAARFVQGLREQRFGDGLRVTCSAGVAALARAAIRRPSSRRRRGALRGQAPRQGPRRRGARRAEPGSGAAHPPQRLRFAQAA